MSLGCEGLVFGFFRSFSWMLDGAFLVRLAWVLFVEGLHWVGVFRDSFCGGLAGWMGVFIILLDENIWWLYMVLGRVAALSFLI